MREIGRHFEHIETRFEQEARPKVVRPSDLDYSPVYQESEKPKELLERLNSKEFKEEIRMAKELEKFEYRVLLDGTYQDACLRYYKNREDRAALVKSIFIKMVLDFAFKSDTLKIQIENSGNIIYEMELGRNEHPRNLFNILEVIEKEVTSENVVFRVNEYTL